ncbi:MAG: DUF6976 family protein [Deltaproteobacteria bacterium]
MDGLFDRDATAGLIQSGKRLLLAGDEVLLASLPRGEWIGGTTPYLMGRGGAIRSTDYAYVAELPGDHAGVFRYGPRGLPHIARHHPGHGFTLLLLPGLSAIQRTFAENVARYRGVFDRPLVGWVSSVALEDMGKVAPKVFDGTSGESTADQGVAMHVVLPPGQRASVDVVNLFAPGAGDAIVFPDGGFEATTALVNGRPVNFAAYLTERKADTTLPLVAERDGAMVNVSFKSVDAAAGVVSFYAPVQASVEYRLAAPVPNFAERFAERVQPAAPRTTFGCHCIFNYLSGRLGGRLGGLVGPMVFGQVAYVLLNQTAVCLSIVQGSLTL